MVFSQGLIIKELNYLGILRLNAADVLVAAAGRFVTPADTSVADPTTFEVSVKALIGTTSIVVVMVMVTLKLMYELELSTSTVGEILALIQATASGIRGS